MADVVVREGDSISSLLRDSGNPRWSDPDEWAKVTGYSSKNPNLIFPGETLSFPDQNQGPSYNMARSVPGMNSLSTSGNVGVGTNAPNFQGGSWSLPKPLINLPYNGGYGPNRQPQPNQSQSQNFSSMFQSMNPFNPPTAKAAETNIETPSAQLKPYNPTYRAGGAVSSPTFVNGTPDWVKPLVEKAATKYNIPSALLSALLKQESGFQPNAVSPVGAKGIAQFMPETARSFGIDPSDPAQAIDAAARYLRTEWDYFGKPELALAAYNAGRGAVQQYGGIPPYKETQNYVKNIMAMAGEPHQSYYGPALNMIAEAKKGSQ